MKYLAKVIIPAILVVIIFAAFLFLFSGGLPQANISLPTAMGQSHNIVFDGERYTPDTIEIKKGDTISFENKSDKPFWPASNIHPTHGIYSELDPKQTVSAGESWSFKFDKAGKWRFHDHLYPYLTGTITVN